MSNHALRSAAISESSTPHKNYLEKLVTFCGLVPSRYPSTDSSRFEKRGCLIMLSGLLLSVQAVHHTEKGL